MAFERTRLLHSQDFERLHQNLCSDRTRILLAAKRVKFQEFMIPLSSQAALLELLHVAVLCMYINHLSSRPSCLYKSVIFVSKQSR
jgi:hypothetical protein